MVNILFKKSYQHKTLKKISFDDLWNKKGIFTTIRVIGKPGNLKISEIEALNPSFSDHKFPEETRYHNKVLSKTIESYLD